MLGDLIIPATSLGIGLSIALKLEGNCSGGCGEPWLSGQSTCSLSRRFNPWRLPWIFFSSSWLTNVDGMKDLWCSSTVWLLSTQDMNGVKDLWRSSTVWLST